MSNISINTQQRYKLNGVTENAPVKWEDATIVAEYKDDDVQPSLSISEFEFNLEARKSILKWITDGNGGGGVGIFEGMPFTLELFNNQPQIETFNHFLDFSKGLKDFMDEGRLDVSLVKDGGMDHFFEQLGGLTFGYLEEIGHITSSDYTIVPYVVEKKFNMMEIMMSSIVIYLMVKELAESVEKTANSIALVASLLTTSAFPVPIGSIAYAIAVALINVIYTLILLLAIIDMAQTLINTLVPPVREHKAILLKTAMEKVCSYLGYTFTAPSIPEFDHVVYIPSNPNLDEKTILGFISVTKGTQSGIPNSADYGYKCDEFFQLAKRLTLSKMAIFGNDVHLRPKNDPYWIQQANWNFPDTLIKSMEWNTDELKSTRLLTFQTDLNDENTIDNYDGTAYEVKTEPVAVNNQKAVMLKGLDEVNFQVALGTRKNELNAIEKLIKGVANLIDATTSVFGGGTNFAGQINQKVGVLKQTSNWHAIPKTVYMNGSSLPTNHRSLWNAQVLYDKYHVEKSFVKNNFNGQKIVHKGIDIQFGFEDYKKLTLNSYFLFNGQQAKITRIEWTMGMDTAKVDLWIREPYTTNLKETGYKPN